MRGTVDMSGRVSGLIELGAGFHPDMSGRENIYTNASIFGLSKKEIDARVDEIIAFSELEDYIDNPVRTYSSGMYMRLAFSVAINVDADILLIDEILAVGDAHFQEKCFEKMQEIKKSGTTIVIVSHSLGQIEEICDRSIWIDAGRIRMDGQPKEVHEKYLEYMGVKTAEQKREKIHEEQEKEREKQNHTRDDGTVYGMYSFARKIGQAIAGGLSGWALGWIGYDELATSQTQEVANGIYNLSTFFPAIIYALCGLALLLIYPLSKAKVEANVKELESRRK